MFTSTTSYLCGYGSYVDERIFKSYNHARRIDIGYINGDLSKMWPIRPPTYSEHFPSPMNLPMANPEQGWNDIGNSFQGHLKMPIQAPQWTEYLSCPVCESAFELRTRLPISISSCGHTICKSCLATLQRRQCPFDQVSLQYFHLVAIWWIFRQMATIAICTAVSTPPHYDCIYYL